MDRRSFLKAGATGVGLAAMPTALTACTPGTTAPPTEVFSLGVAAGLQSPTEVVLWTRVEPTLIGSATTVTVDVSSSPSMTPVVQSSTVAIAGASNDHTIKTLVGGLDPDTSYWYRFTADPGTGAVTSPVGRARTLPAAGSATTSLKLAYASCQAYACGYYAAWRGIAAQDVDAVLFLGDYIYEAPTIQLLGKVRDETTDTATTLTDYRARYRLYKSDPDLQAAHAAHPFALIWDDHEVSNDYDSTWLTTDPARVAAAYQAWFEYQPVWPIVDNQIYHSLQWGSLGEIFLLDTRQYRDAHRGGAPLVGVRELTDFEAAPNRTLMGATQRQWLFDGLDAAQAAGRTWKIIGNQVMIAPIREVDLDTPEARAADPSLPTHAGVYSNANFDSWDGYGWERDQLLGHLHSAGIENTAFVTGDYHSFWQAALTTDFDDPTAPVVANDFVSGAISSAGGAFTENTLYGGIPPTSPGFSYVDTVRNGYGTVEVTPTTMVVTYWANLAIYAGPLPTATVKFTLNAGDPNAVRELLA